MSVAPLHDFELDTICNSLDSQEVNRYTSVRRGSRGACQKKASQFVTMQSGLMPLAEQNLCSHNIARHKGQCCMQIYFDRLWAYRTLSNPMLTP